jgi:hypothetical protein
MADVEAALCARMIVIRRDFIGFIDRHVGN